MKILACVLAACLSSACASAKPEGKPVAGKASRSEQHGAGTDAAKKKLPPPPAIFDVHIDDNPKKLEKRLSELGYQRQDWTLEEPYSRLTFILEDESATFRQVDMLVCNHPVKLADIRIQGKDPNAFYEAVKRRFNLGITEWDDRADSRYATYKREFAGHTWVVLNRTRQSSHLTLEARDVKAECRSALKKDMDDLRSAEQAEIQAAKQKQQDSF